MLRHRWLIALAAFVSAFVLVAADNADARAGKSSSSGSRGSRTYSTPAPTATAPNAASPIQRSATQPSSVPGAATTGAGAAARPGLFGGGLLGGLAAGFIGAGLFGMLFGHGFLGGMGGFASILGLIIQVVLIVIVARLAWGWWQRRNQPAYAAASPQDANPRQNFNALGGMFGANRPSEEPVNVVKEDYDDFERLLGEVQSAYSDEDLGRLRAHVTPEMVSYFSEELAENASHRLINKVSDVRLLQGDLSEAWREDATEYATVAMRFGLTDSMVDRASGRTVQGGSPDEVTELWTFRRPRGGRWMVSAIQQA